MAYETEAIAIGRILLGLYFAASGLNHFGKAEDLSGWLEANSLPAPQLLVYLSGGQLLLAGLGLAAGVLPVLSAMSLVAFVILASFLLHDFWNREGEEKESQMTHFMKNTGLIAGLLVTAGVAGSQGVSYAVYALQLL